MTDRLKPPQPPSPFPPEAGLPGLSHRRNWFRTRSWMRSEHLQQWIQSLAILVGTIWAIYTFWYKDILVPAQQPANLSLDITITPVAGSAPGPGGLETILEAQATNSSTKSVYLLNNYWHLSGLPRIADPASTAATEDQLLQQANTVISKGYPFSYETALPNPQDPVFLAVGRLFSDNVIQPGETARRSLLIRIPPHIHALELKALLPLVNRNPEDQSLFKGRTLRWQLDDPFNLVPQLCRPEQQDITAGEPSEPSCDRVDVQTIDEQIKRFDSHYLVINFRKQYGLPNRSGSPP